MKTVLADIMAVCLAVLLLLSSAAIAITVLVCLSRWVYRLL
ncbi:hypothetical protein [Thiothrix subterranea]|uniref:Uncharacterized protein n=1 Tax=Thiothrix subterranea TaxID=2735563 RepID=A0AA51MM63_9GAMM|nr:hypothetical protein [Thiothrix subterranea]MDQ5768736.1 hypothetical protein [Thiothrix subterranea]WML84887.1 hypothetical protein RCG00_00190 [Thiothrix subterranea]